VPHNRTGVLPWFCTFGFGLSWAGFDQVGEAVLGLRAYFVIAQAAWLSCWGILYLKVGGDEGKNKVIWVKAVV